MNAQMIEAVSKAIFDAAAKKYSDNVTEKWLADTFAKAAIAAVFQEIREAAGRDDVVEAGLSAQDYDRSLKRGGLTMHEKRAIIPKALTAMLDQIERNRSHDR